MAKQLKHGGLTYAIIGCCQRVHAALGPGFPESVYQKALSVELIDAKIPFEGEKAYEVFYKGHRCGEFRADIVADQAVIVELKALSALSADHMAQVLSYLKASGLEVALLVNFGRKSLEFQRVVL